VETTSSFHQPTQDGGNSSDTRMPTLSTKKERLWMSKATMTVRTEMSSCGTDITVSTNNGISYILMLCQLSQRRVNSIKTSVCMLRDHSMLSLNCQNTGISILLETIWSSRLQMDSILKYGGSIKNPRLSNLNCKSTEDGTSRAQEDQITCKFGTQTVDGSNCLNMRYKTS